MGTIKINNERIEVGFSFTGYKILEDIRYALKGIKEFSTLPREDPLTCRNLTPGEMIIQPSEDVDLSTFVEILHHDYGYSVIGVKYQSRVDSKDLSGRTYFHHLSFVFTLNAQEHPLLYPELQRFCRESLWKVKVYKNQEHVNGKPVSGKFFFSIACSGRKPLTNPDGSRILVWPRDEEGRKQKDGQKIPIPFKATLSLIEDQFIMIVA